MRRVLTAFVLCFFSLTTVFTVSRASGDPTWNGDRLLTPGLFSIDGTYCEAGMNAPYEAGYAPDISDGLLTVILPLVASAPVDGDVIYCGLDLGSREDSPFLYQNYQSIPVRLRQPEPAQDDDDPALYVGRFVLPLAPDRRNGIYPLGVSIRFRAGGKELEQLFTIDFTVEDAAAEPTSPGSSDPSGGSGSGDPGHADPGYTDPGYTDPGYADPGDQTGAGGGTADGSGVSQEPKVILESAVYAPNPAPAGEPFTVTGTLRNTSKKQRVSNMTVSYKSQTTDLIPVGGSSTQYIEEIKADSAVQFAFQMESRLDAQSGPQKIDLALGYDGADGAAYQASDEITVQIQQSVRLEYDQPQFPPAVYIGDSMSTTLNLFNKGKGTLYNVTVALTIPGIEPESSAFVGNMESGSSKSADIYASVVGLPADGEEAVSSVMAIAEETVAEAAEEEAAAAGGIMMDEDVAVMPDASGGETSGEFLVAYEDEFGSSGELRIPVQTEIMAMEPFEEPLYEPDEPEPEAGFPWWGWALIGGGGAAAAAVPLVRRRRKKRPAALAAELDDELL